MALSNDRIKELIIMHLKDEMTEGDRMELEHWLQLSEVNRLVYNQLNDPGQLQADMQEIHEVRGTIWQKIEFLLQADMQKGLQEEQLSGFQEAQAKDTKQIEPTILAHHRLYKRVPVAAAAACLLFLFAAGAFWWATRPEKSSFTNAGSAGNKPGNDILPGSSKATLTLANGSVVILEKTADGSLARQGDAHLIKEKDRLEYTLSKNEKSSVEDKIAGDDKSSPFDKTVGKKSPPPVVYNTLTTPNAGQFQLVLPDGSKVWLNNASSLRYPTSFSGNNRTVELTGEAYFEIAPRSDGDGHVKVPFSVKINGLFVNVLGTSFNIMAYAGEKKIRTTLLSGKVQLVSGDKKTLLAPGEQAVVPVEGTMEESWQILKDINTEQAISWKRGYFHFDHTNIEEALQQLARWYDIDVKFEIPVPDYRYDGEIDRNLTLSAILTHMEKKDLHFHIEGKKLIVSK
ncbi:FecR family protein [Flavitalea flava]